MALYALGVRMVLGNWVFDELSVRMVLGNWVFGRYLSECGVRMILGVRMAL